MPTSDIAVSVRGLFKAYTIAHNEERQVSLIEQMLQRLTNTFKQAETEAFSAVKGVLFSTKMGDVVGIMGQPCGCHCSMGQWLRGDTLEVCPR